MRMSPEEILEAQKRLHGQQDIAGKVVLLVLLCAFIVACFIFGPWIWIWAINTVILANIPGTTMLTFEFFVAHYWAIAFFNWSAMIKAIQAERRWKASR